MTLCCFAIPGDLGLPTGGYAYDRQLLARLAAHGVEARHLALPASYPAPSEADLGETERRLAGAPRGAVLLVDGLALGAMPADLLRRIVNPLVALCHHPLAHEAGLQPGRAAELHASEQAALALARHVIVTSATTARTLAAEFAVPASRTTVAEPGTERAPRAMGSGARQDAPVSLVAVGSLVPRKGYDVLVDALAGLPAVSDVAWRLAIAGSDDRSPQTTARLQAQIAAAGLGQRIALLGALDEQRLGELYASADIFLMPSLYEGYGMVLTEAMARGLPIVCTTGGAAAETVPDAAAIKVPPGDAMAFRSALARLLADRALRGRMSDASWAAAASLPTWDDTARIVADVIHRAAGR